MSEKKAVRFLKDWKFAYGGVHVVAYKEGDQVELNEEALQVAFDDGVVELALQTAEQLEAAKAAATELAEKGKAQAAALKAEPDEAKKAKLTEELKETELAFLDAEKLVSDLEKQLAAEKKAAAADAKKTKKK